MSATSADAPAFLSLSLSVSRVLFLLRIIDRGLISPLPRLPIYGTNKVLNVNGVSSLFSYIPPHDSWQTNPGKAGRSASGRDSLERNSIHREDTETEDGMKSGDAAAPCARFDFFHFILLHGISRRSIAGIGSICFPPGRTEGSSLIREQDKCSLR